jgi:ubiquinone biosynthesis protein
MLDWNLILDEIALADVFPGEYARFVRPIREGLIVFLEGLPESHQTEILVRQSALPPDTTISHRLAALARDCPVLHKLGQVLARDQRLAPQLREHLRELESLEPTVSKVTISQIIEQELGPLNRLGIRLAPPAIAEASVAVVIPFEPVEEKRTRGKRVGVLKVLKPGIEERLGLELELLGHVGSHLDERCEELKIPRLDYEESFEQIREKLANEIRLDHEQQHLVEAARFYADEARVHIPAVLEFCTPRVTAMERICGWKVTDHHLVGRCRRRQLADVVVRAMIARPMFSLAPHPIFHGDPHAGNLFLTDENRLAILDWSLVGSIDHRERVAIAKIIQYAVMFEPTGIAGVLENLSERKPIDRPNLVAVVERAIRRVRQGTLPGLNWLVELLDDAVHTAGLRAGADLMVLRKSLHTLEGVVAEIAGPAFRIDDVLLADFLGHFAAELPRRFVAPLESREFATRLSNLDLAQAWLASPLALARFWMRQSFDMLNACCEFQRSAA